MSSPAENTNTSDALPYLWMRGEDPRRDRVVAFVFHGIAIVCGLEAFRIGAFVVADVPVGGILGIVPVRTLGWGDALILFVAAAFILLFFVVSAVRLVTKGWPRAISLDEDDLIVEFDGSRKTVLRMAIARCRDLDVVQRGLLAGRGWQVRCRIVASSFFTYPYVVLARCETEPEAEKLARELRAMYHAQLNPGTVDSGELP